jgi:hypothetical protein
MIEYILHCIAHFSCQIFLKNRSKVDVDYTSKLGFPQRFGAKYGCKQCTNVYNIWLITVNMFMKILKICGYQV